MAGAKRSCAWVLAALLVGSAGATVWAQSPSGADAGPATNEIHKMDLGAARGGRAAQSGTTDGGRDIGSIAGRLTDLYSKPLVGATVVLRSEATEAEQRTTTGRNGSYRFVGVAAGEYTLEAESESLGRGRLVGIVVAAGHEARLQTAMEFRTEAPVMAAIEAALATAAPTRPLEPEPREVRVTENAPAVPAPEAPKAEPLAGTLAMRVPREAPTPASPEVVAPVTAEPLEQLAVSGWRMAERASEIPATVVPLVTAALDPEILAGLPLTGSELGQAQESSPARIAAGDMDPVTPVVTTAMTAEQVQGLPVGGRRWQDFELNSPTSASAPGGGTQTSLRGAGLMPAEMTVDGAHTGLAFGATGEHGAGSLAQTSRSATGGMGQAWAGGQGFAVGETAIREVQTTAGNVEAEGERAAGGRVHVETAVGGNKLHGQGFLFDRQNTWGAQNPFTQWVKETAAATETTTPVFTPENYTPPDHETTWGIGAGGRIRRDKMFWFAALDSLQRNDPGLATVKHPTVFFAQPSNDDLQVLSARLGLSSANPVGAGLGAYSAMLQTLDGLLGSAPRTATQWTGFARIDWQAAERHRFTLEGIGAEWDSPGGGLRRVAETDGADSFGTSEASEEWLLGRWEAFLTPNLLAVSQGSAGRSILSAHPETPSAFEQTFLSPSIWGQLPQILVDSRYGFTIGNPSRFGEGSYPDERSFEGQEMLDWVHGKLLIKAGFELSHNADATSLLRNETGTYSYASVENFASDALAFAAFGVGGELNPMNQHNCDQTGKAWRDSGGTLRGLGYLPCYASFSQTLGPTNWNLSTNDWAGYVTAQWQPKPLFVVSAGLRWEFEQLPPPIAALANAQLPLTEKLPSLGSDLGPRISLAVGNAKSHWPVLRLGYGMYFGRTENATLETELTQTGSAKGDLKFFMRPTDNLIGGGAPPFPYVPAGEPGNVVKPGAQEFAPNFRNPEVHQAVAAVEETLPGHVEVTASAMVSLGRRLPVFIDANLAPPPAEPQTQQLQFITYNVCEQVPTGQNNGTCGNLGLGPIKAAQIKVPFYASNASSGVAGWINPDYQQIDELTSKANSTYEAAMVKVARYGRRGLSLHAHYTYSHTMDWNPNEIPLNTANFVAGSDFSQGYDLGLGSGFSEEYGTSDLDMRHSAAAMVAYETPWKLHKLAGRLGNGWMLSGTGHFHSGMPYTMRTSGSLAEEFTTSGTAVVGLGPGMNGSGGDNRIYGVGSDNLIYNIGRNTYRYPSTWKADLRLGKSFNLGEMRRLEFLLESFNLFNHQNVTELETTGYTIESGSPPSALGGAGTLPTLNFLTGLKTNLTTGLTTPAFGQPLNVNATDFYRERQVQAGLRLRF